MKLSLSYSGNPGGVTFYRNDIIGSIFNSKFGKSHHIATSRAIAINDDLLKNVDSIRVLARPNGPIETNTEINLLMFLKRLRQEKGFQYKLMADVDDLIWDVSGEPGALPDYNQYFQIVDIAKSTEGFKAIAANVDHFTVSTEYLGKKLKKDFGSKYGIVKNTVPKSLFYSGKSERDSNDKIRILFSGSGTHYSNKMKMYGDFSPHWVETIRKLILEDKAEFHCFAQIPWFLQDLKNHIVCYDWMDSYTYCSVIRNFKFDVMLCPLIDNEFNRCKSNIRMLEGYAAGIPVIASNFPYSPYSDSILQVDERNIKDEKPIVNLINKLINNPAFYSDTLKKQYKFMEKNHYYTEDDNNLIATANIFFRDQVKKPK